MITIPTLAIKGNCVYVHIGKERRPVQISIFVSFPENEPPICMYKISMTHEVTNNVWQHYYD